MYFPFKQQIAMNFFARGKDLLLKFFKQDLNSKKEENSENLNKINTVCIK